MDILKQAYRHASRYRADVDTRQVAPESGFREMRDRFAAPLPETGMSESAVIDELVKLGEQGLMQTTSPRFFGWVMGGSSLVSVAADWLVSAWGQNAALQTTSPTASAIEEITAGWLLDILDLPRDAAVGFVSGATLGSFAALSAARGSLLHRAGWDCASQGLFGAPEINVFTGEDVHASIMAALRYLGFGEQRVIRVASDSQGRMCPNDLARQTAIFAGPKLIIAQAGQINTGAFDDFTRLSDISKQHKAWLHIDGAFGLWARANADMRTLTNDIEHADSWVVDGHKWLQVPFDSGYAIVKDRAALQSSMKIFASYLPEQTHKAAPPCFLVPELSRRARALPTWAAIKTLGRSGVSEMVQRHCRLARHIARTLASVEGITVMNEVVLNQVIICFGAKADGPQGRRTLTEEVMKRLVEDGQIYVAGADWRGEKVMRLSVIGGTITAQDAEIAISAIRSTWRQIQNASSPPFRRIGG